MHGVDLRALMGGEGADLSMASVLLEPVLYGSFGWWLLWAAAGLSFASAMLGSVYPAIFAARTEPAKALRVE